jgi:hypothetical protein
MRMSTYHNHNMQPCNLPTDVDVQEPARTSPRGHARGVLQLSAARATTLSEAACGDDVFAAPADQRSLTNEGH